MATGSVRSPVVRARVARQYFLKNALAAVDRKGRLALPLDYRRAIEGNSGERVVAVADHSALPCILGHDRAWLEEQTVRYDAQASSASQADRLAAEAELAELTDNYDFPGFDEAGRFQLSGFLLAHAAITDLAYFRATSMGFQIWNPERLIAEATVSERLRAKVRWELDHRGRA